LCDLRDLRGQTVVIFVFFVAKIFVISVSSVADISVFVVA